MTTVLPCRHRGDIFADRCECRSPFLKLPRSNPSVLLSFCGDCPYRDRVELINIGKLNVAPPAPPPSEAKCVYLGDTLRDERGRAVTRECSTGL